MQPVTGCFFFGLTCQKPGFLAKYWIQTLNLGKKPGFFLGVTNRGFPRCTGGRGQ